MKRIKLGILLGIMMIALLAISCSENIKNKGTGTVGLVIAEDKSLSSEVNKEIVSYEFMATPLFSLATNEFIYGQVSEWREITVNNASADLGVYTSGMWLFELRAKNSNDKIISVGSTQQIVRERKNNTIHITLLMDSANNTHGESTEKGSVHIGLELNQFDTDKNNIRITTRVQKINPDGSYTVESTPFIDFISYASNEHFTQWYDEDTSLVGEGKMYFEGELENQDAGAYIYKIFVEVINTQGAFIAIAGQTLDVRVIGGEETAVKGTLLANKYMEGNLEIEAPNLKIGSMKVGNQTQDYFVGDLNNPILLKYQADVSSTETIATYQWFVNGVLQEDATSANFSISCPEENSKKKFGIYNVTCTAMGTLGSVVSKSVLVDYRPEEGIAYEFDWEDDEPVIETKNIVYYFDDSRGFNTEMTHNPQLFNNAEKTLSLYPYIISLFMLSDPDGANMYEEAIRIIPTIASILPQEALTNETEKTKVLNKIKIFANTIDYSQELKDSIIYACDNFSEENENEVRMIFANNNMFLEKTAFEKKSNMEALVCFCEGDSNVWSLNPYSNTFIGFVDLISTPTGYDINLTFDEENYSEQGWNTSNPDNKIVKLSITPLGIKYSDGFNPIYDQYEPMFILAIGNSQRAIIDAATILGFGEYWEHDPTNIPGYKNM